MKIFNTKKTQVSEINNSYSNSLMNPKSFSIILIIIAMLIGGFYLLFAWNRHKDTAVSEAIVLAQSLEALLHTEHIQELSGSTEDIYKPEYIMAKLSLKRLVETTNSIQFAYIFGQQDGNIVFLLDSESPDSADYSPPGQIYYEASDIDWHPLISGEAVLTRPTTDRWGTWVSVLTPIKDLNSGSVIAVLGLDYSASQWQLGLWKKMIPDIIIVFVLFMVFSALLYIKAQNSRLNRLNKKITMEEALYHSIFEQAPIGVALMEDKRLAIRTEFGDMHINQQFEKILGRDKSDLRNITWLEITHPDDLAADLEKFHKFKNGEINGYSMEKRFIRPDGSIVWTYMIISKFSNDAENSSRHLCLIEDISASKQAENELKEIQRRETVILSHLPGLAYRCKFDVAWTMEYVSEGCYNLTGYAPDSLLNNKDLSYSDLISPEYRELLWNEWQRILNKRLPFKYEYEIITSTGDRKWVLEMGQGIYNEKGEVEALEGIILDISDRRDIEKNLKYVIEHDIWTGLHNREYLENLLEKDNKNQSMVKRAVISINLRMVQLLTFNYGFHYTQNLIKKAAEVLGGFCSDTRLLFKTYENRFVFYMKDYEDKNELLKFSQEIAKELEALFAIDRIGGGIGILEIDKDNREDIDQLLKKLLIASESAIDAFENNFFVCFYDADLEAKANRETEIMQELGKIANNETDNGLFLLFQPIMDLKSNSICGFEALARLNSENFGLVTPVEFIPIAEKSKLIIPLGEKIIVNALGFLKRIQEHGYEGVHISINVSAIQLLSPDFTSRFFEIIREMKINPRDIGIEITESVFTRGYDDINSIIGELQDAGINISIDDFGTEYSSLAREWELNVDCLKIDKYFVDKLLVVDAGNAITGDIISIAHKLGHCAVAEGVEYKSQLQYLRDHDCDKIQGYLISKPLDQEAALNFLKIWPKYYPNIN